MLLSDKMEMDKLIDALVDHYVHPHKFLNGEQSFTTSDITKEELGKLLSVYYCKHLEFESDCFVRHDFEVAVENLLKFPSDEKKHNIGDLIIKCIYEAYKNKLDDMLEDAALTYSQQYASENGMTCSTDEQTGSPTWRGKRG